MKTLYAIDLKPTAAGATARYAVYEMDAQRGMVPLWGCPTDTKTTTEMTRWEIARTIQYPHQVYYRRPINGPDRYPAYHFKLTGYGYNKLHELAQSLACHFGEDVEILTLTGWVPRRDFAKAPSAETRKAAEARADRAEKAARGEWHAPMTPAEIKEHEDRTRK